VVILVFLLQYLPLRTSVEKVDDEGQTALDVAYATLDQVLRIVYITYYGICLA
jgi:hypothetical protein